MLGRVRAWLGWDPIGRAARGAARRRKEATWTVKAGLGLGLAAVTAAGALSIGHSIAQSTPTVPVAPALPSVKVLRGPLVSPTTANSFYGSATTSTDGLCRDYGPAQSDTTKRVAAICTGTTHPVPEVKALARALKNDPNLIYEYMLNSVDTEFLFGAHKGPLGVIIDHSGTPFDQAELMAGLLKEAGYTPSYQYGTLTLTQAQFFAWTGIGSADGSTTDARAACDFLATGGIPAVINGVSGTTDCSAFSGALSSVVMSHVWVSATGGSFGSSSYFFDPSYKVYQHKRDIGVRSLMGFTAGAPVSSASGGMSSGSSTASNGSSEPYVAGLARSTLETQLKGYGTTLLGKFNDPTNHPELQGADLIDVVGGRIIQRSTRPSGGWLLSTPSNYSSSATWSGVPDQFRAVLGLYSQGKKADGTTIVFVNATFFADEVYGRRLQLQSQPYDSSGAAITNGDPAGAATTWVPKLVLDGGGVQSGASFAAPNALVLDVALLADHPFAAADPTVSGAAAGSYGDTLVKKIVDILNPATIVHGWGHTSPGLLAKWEHEQTWDAPGTLTMALSPSADLSEVDTPNSGDLFRAKVAATWLAQFSREADLHGELANARPVLLHTLGVVSSNQTVTALPPSPGPGGDLPPPGFTIRDETSVVDLETGFGLVSRTYDLPSRKATVHAIAATAAALEGSVVAQLTDGPDVASTASRFAWGNNPESGETPSTTSRKVYRFNSSTDGADVTSLLTYDGSSTAPAAYAGATSTTTFNGPAIDQSTFDTVRGQTAAAVKAYTSQGFEVVASSEASLGPGHRYGSLYPAFTVGGLSNGTGGLYTGALTNVCEALSTQPTDGLSGYVDCFSSTGGCPLPGGRTTLPSVFDTMSNCTTADGFAGRIRTIDDGFGSLSNSLTGNVNTIYQRLPTLQRGGALIATKYAASGSNDPTQIAHVLTRWGHLTKGGGGPSVVQVQKFDPAEAGQSLKDRFVDRSSAQGVNLSSGTAGFHSPTLSSIGQGEFPYKLEQHFELKGSGVRPGRPTGVMSADFYGQRQPLEPDQGGQAGVYGQPSDKGLDRGALVGVEQGRDGQARPVLRVRGAEGGAGGGEAKGGQRVQSHVMSPTVVVASNAGSQLSHTPTP